MATGIEKVSATLTAAVTLTPNGTADNTTLPE